MEDLSIKNVGDLRYSISVSHRDTAFFVLTPFKMIQRRRSKHSWSSIGSFVGWLWLITINIVSMCPWLGLQKKHQASRGTSQDFRLGSFGAIFFTRLSLDSPMFPRYPGCDPPGPSSEPRQDQEEPLEHFQRGAWGAEELVCKAAKLQLCQQRHWNINVIIRYNKHNNHNDNNSNNDKDTYVYIYICTYRLS